MRACATCPITIPITASSAPPTAPAIPALYARHLAPHLDDETRGYWETRRRFGFGEPRISVFTRNLYRHGLLGRFIGFGHAVAKLYGVDPRDMLQARTLQEQRAYFDQVLAPLFEKRFIRWFADRPISLYGLGIPPAQYAALAGAGPGGMSAILRQRVEKLTCSFSLNDNYFAWQALGRVLRQGWTRTAAALSARGAFRRDPQPRRSGAGAQSLRHRIPAGRARSNRPTAMCCSTRRTG